VIWKKVWRNWESSDLIQIRPVDAEMMTTPDVFTEKPGYQSGDQGVTTEGPLRAT
jgi:hypothetical protein